MFDKINYELDMNILDKIIAHKKQEVTQLKAEIKVSTLIKSPGFKRTPLSLKKELLDPKGSGIIAEFKRKSPSKGDINAYANVEKISIGYMQAGASALSVLTDTHFFNGQNKDLITARKFNFCPILRKEFVVDEYQIIEAKSIGADAILLIAECLTAQEIKTLSKLAKSLNMEVLLEVHSSDQLGKLCDTIDVVGVNNRDLTTFNVDVQSSIDLANLIPSDFVKISESGINDAKTVIDLKEIGYKGFLIGEHFMKNADPAKTCKNFILEMNALESAKVNKL